jgi:hypothetical protein
MVTKNEQGRYVPNKTFKMPKTMKRIGASIANKELRDHWKFLAIQATIGSEDRPVKKKLANPKKMFE